MRYSIETWQKRYRQQKEQATRWRRKSQWRDEKIKALTAEVEALRRKLTTMKACATYERLYG